MEAPALGAPFAVGTIELDPIAVGVTLDGPGSTFTLDTTVVGNHNGGHAYGTDLPDGDKRALIEYLKTL